GRLDFDVIRNGKDIGDHSYSFTGNPADLTVKVHTDVAVKLPLVRINVYSFTHVSTETWKNGKPAGLSSTTDDDGTPNKLALGTVAALPASLWSNDIAGQTRLLNTIDGHVMAVKVADLGAEQVQVAGGKVKAEHYRISGELARDVWYDDAGLLARLVMTADDGSIVTYVRK
ncbi:MAG: DUF6134 family protein, partial [Erythrobacter sp.]|nr:DUF6134 family protein [Erythrobacter sp.]